MKLWKVDESNEENVVVDGEKGKEAMLSKT